VRADDKRGLPSASFSARTSAENAGKSIYPISTATALVAGPELFVEKPGIDTGLSLFGRRKLLYNARSLLPG